MNEDVMASAFDPDLFQSTQQEAEFDTVEVPIPPADYNALLQKATATQYTNAETAKKTTVMDVWWKLDAPETPDAHERMVKQSVFLDLNETGLLDSGRGKNVSLGRLLEALKLNGKPWRPEGLQGNVAKVKVTQRMGKGEHEGKIFHEIKGVTAI